MSGRYVYDGVLTDEKVRWCHDMMQSYPCPLVLARMPEHVEFKAAYSTRSYVARGESCMGQPTSRERSGIPYGTVTISETKLFLFLPDEEAREVFLATFPEFVLDRNPFKTII